MRPSNLMELARSPGGQKMVRYSLVSVLSVAVSQAVLFATYAPRLWSATVCNIVACVVAGVPSYYLNRTWAWGKSGKSHVWREVVPFWVLAFAGLVLSTAAVALAEDYAKRHLSTHLMVTLMVNSASIAAFGVLWIAKFVIFNKVMFVHHLGDLPEALDGRTGVPT